MPDDEKTTQGLFARLRARAEALGREVVVLSLAVGEPRVPLAARLVAVAVVGYALSPIDLIPDFIPVLGLLDDLIILPLGIALALRLIPAPLMAELRRRAAGRTPAARRAALAAAGVIVALWLALALGLAARFWPGG